MSYLNKRKEKITVGLMQFEIDTNEPTKNIEKIVNFLSKKNDDIVVLPEMSITGFNLKYLENFLKEVDKYLNILTEISNSFKTAICTTLPYREGNYIYNRLFFILPNGEKYWYDKHYLIDWGGFSEGKYFTNGNSYLVIRYFGWIIGFAVCYDIRFPELFYYMNKISLEKYHDFIKLFLVPVQWPTKRIHHFVLLSKARAIENLSYVATTNCIGKLGELQFNGKSMILNPDGEELIFINDQEAKESYTIDLSLVETIQKERPILKDRYRKNYY